MATEWKKVKFNQIFAEPTRNGLSETSSKENDGLKIINMGEVFGYDFISCKQEMRKLPSNKRVNSAFVVKNNDLLFARRSLVESGAGKVSLIKDANIESTVFESSIIRVRLDDTKVLPLFYFYWLKSFYGRAAISPLITGINVKGIRASELAEITVPLPPLETQQKIAGILSAYDDLIENNRKQIKLLEEAAQKLYKEWFVKLNFPGHENVKIVDGVPEGWKKEKLINLVDVQYGYAFDGKLFNSEGKGTPIIRIRNIPDGTTNDFTTEKAPEEYIVHNGDILVGMDGEFHINTWNQGNAYLVQRSCLLRPKKEIMKGYILQAIFEPIKFFEKTVVGATVAHLGKKHIDTIEIWSCPDKFYVPFDNLLKKKQTLQNQIQLLQSARDKLLPKLMRQPRERRVK